MIFPRTVPTGCDEVGGEKAQKAYFLRFQRI
jgi:hypothetical protein